MKALHERIREGALAGVYYGGAFAAVTWVAALLDARVVEARLHADPEEQNSAEAPWRGASHPLSPKTTSATTRPAPVARDLADLADLCAMPSAASSHARSTR